VVNGSEHETSPVTPFERLLEVTRDILQEVELSAALESIARGFCDIFGFRYVTIVAADSTGGDLTRRVAHGYSAELQSARLGEKIERAEIAAVLEPTFLVFENCFFMPAEREIPWAQAIFSGALPYDAPREDASLWHERDALILVLSDARGGMLGYLSVDGPLDGKIPSQATMRSMQIFVNLIGLALAKSYAHATELERNRFLEADQRRLRYDATHDALTGLPNRQCLSDRLEKAIGEAHGAPESTYAVLFIDLDEFKSINDSLGHAAGDSVLVSVAERLLKTVAPQDFVARLGGDEFAVLLCARGEYGQIERCVDEINSALLQPLAIQGRSVFTTASIGIAVISPLYTRIEDLLRDADTAMYHAKTLGRARSILFDSQMHTAATQRLALTSDLRLAIESSQFHVAYQPVISLHNERIDSLEALVRWRHPESGELMPGEFISHAEDVGLIVGIGRFVFSEACARVAEWQASVPDRRLGVSVNLAVQEILQPDLPQFVMNNLERFGVRPQDVTLEITESAMLQSSALTSGTLGRLRELGLKIAVDDFGTGYSSLRYLEQFAVDAIKIDRSFVSGRDGNLASEAIVKMLVELGSSYGVRIIAEGIETMQQLSALRRLGCTFGQGYYFSQPLRPEWVDVALEQANRRHLIR